MPEKNSNRALSIDVCVLTFNNAETVERCLNGARKALGPALGRFRVVDNGSMDETVSMVKSQSECHRDIDLEIRPELTMGQARARSYEMADGEWIIGLDADIVLRDNYLEELLCRLDEDVGGVEPVRMNHYAVSQSNAPHRSLGGQNLIRRSAAPRQIPYDMCGEDEYTRCWVEQRGLKWIFVDKILADHYPCSPRYRSGFFLTRYTGCMDSWANLDRNIRHWPFPKQYLSFLLTWVFWMRWHTRDFLLKCIHYARGWRSSWTREERSS